MNTAFRLGVIPTCKFQQELGKLNQLGAMGQG